MASGPTARLELPLGRHVFTLFVKDGAGSIALDDVVVTIADTTPPRVHVRVPDDCVWPPNHKYVRYELGRDIHVEAHDVCFGDLSRKAEILKVTNSQDDASRDRCSHTNPDVTGDEDAVCIRAERCGDEDRIYTVTVGVRDPAGNQGTDDYPVVVPESPVFTRWDPHPVTPKDLVGKGHVRQCGAEPDGAFIHDRDHRCRFTPGQIETLAQQDTQAGSASEGDEHDVADTAAQSGSGAGDGAPPAGGCAVAGGDPAGAALPLMALLAALGAGWRRSRRRF